MGRQWLKRQQIAQHEGLRGSNVNSESIIDVQATDTLDSTSTGGHARILADGFSGLKICFLAGTLEHGGAERQLFYWLRLLCQYGIRPTVLSLDHGEFWETPILDLGLPVIMVGEHPSRLKRLFRIAKEFRTCRAPILQSQHFFANGYAGLVGRMLGLRSIGAIRNDGVTEVQQCWRIGGPMNLRLPGLLAANSQRGLRYALRQGISAKCLYFLPNVIDTERFTPPDDPAPSPLTLLAVGRVVEQKRLDRFLTVLSRLRGERDLKVKGLIVGPAREHEGLRQRLERLARDLGLFPGAVQFCGPIADMPRIYHQASVAVLTSDHEGTPNTLLEAMACGLPVVATRVGGVPEIVQEGQTGYLRERDDLDGLVAAVAELLTDPELRRRMGRNARNFVQKNHSLVRLPMYLSELYRLALPQRRAQRSASEC